jgi:hypothetical protein
MYDIPYNVMYFHNYTLHQLITDFLNSIYIQPLSQIINNTHSTTEQSILLCNNNNNNNNNNNECFITLPNTISKLPEDGTEVLRHVGSFVIYFNPYPANVEINGKLLIMPADGRWELIRFLKG